MSSAVIDLEVDDVTYAAHLLVTEADHPLGAALRMPCPSARTVHELST